MSEGAYESADERLAWVTRARDGDALALEKAVAANLPLVTYLAKRFLRPEVEFEDLFQTGCVGLMKAIRRFEPEYGTAFSTYAVPVILGEMRRLLRDGGQMHVARSIRERAAAIARYERDFARDTGREPTFGELSQALGFSREEIALAYGARRPVVSLDAPAPGMEDMTNADTVGDEGMRAVEESIVFRQLLGALEEDERRLIDMRYRQGRTQAEAGRLLGMTQVQVCRREKRILARLRELSGGL